MIEGTLERWHKVLEKPDWALLDDLLADDVVFHSPVVHTPQAGKALTQLYLSGAYQALVAGGAFRYVREVKEGDNATLEFVTEVDGVVINGVDMIRCNDEGRIVEFKVMIRPLKAIHTVHRKMGEMLQELASR